MQVVEHYPAGDAYIAVVEDANGNRFVLDSVGAHLTLSEAERLITQQMRDQYAVTLTERSVAAKTQLNAADFDAAKKAIETAKSVEDIVKTLPVLVELVARLAEAMGMTPVTPEAVGS